MKKRIFVGLLVASMMTMLAACGKEEPVVVTDDQTATTDVSGNGEIIDDSTTDVIDELPPVEEIVNDGVYGCWGSLDGSFIIYLGENAEGDTETKNFIAIGDNTFTDIVGELQYLEGTAVVGEDTITVGDKVFTFRFIDNDLVISSDVSEVRLTPITKEDFNNDMMYYEAGLPDVEAVNVDYTLTTVVPETTTVTTDTTDADTTDTTTDTSTVGNEGDSASWYADFTGDTSAMSEEDYTPTGIKDVSGTYRTDSGTSFTVSSNLMKFTVDVGWGPITLDLLGAAEGDDGWVYTWDDGDTWATMILDNGKNVWIEIGDPQGDLYVENTRVAKIN